jgi:autotransporter-associated beta strand protein
VNSKQSITFPVYHNSQLIGGVPRKSDSFDRSAATSSTKVDPYASRTHRRIDVLLLVVTILILFLVLHASAHGQTVTVGSGATRVNDTEIQPITDGGYAEGVQLAQKTGGGSAEGVQLAHKKPKVGGDPTWVGPNNNSANPGSGNWGTAANWDNNPTGVGTGSSTTALVFGGSLNAQYTATNNTGASPSTLFQFLSITLNSTSNQLETLDATGSRGLDVQFNPSITQSARGAFTISMPISSNTNNNGTNTLTLNGDGSGTVTLSGVVSDESSQRLVAITKSGASTFVLSGTNTYSGGTTVSGGTLLVTGGATGSSTASGTGTGTVGVTGSGTFLAGGSTSGTTGTILGAVSIGSGSHLSPGTSGDGTTTTAILHTGAVSLSSGSFFNVNINGTTAGSSYDQLVVTGTVNLGGTLASNLVVNAGAGLTVGQKFFIVLNDGTDAVSGTFAQGTTVTSGNDIFTINYADNGDGGSVGNDISLTLTAIPESSTWIAGALAVLGVGYVLRKRVTQLFAWAVTGVRSCCCCFVLFRCLGKAV